MLPQDTTHSFGRRCGNLLLKTIFETPLISEVSDLGIGYLTKLNQLNLWCEEFGERSDPVVLLIMGAYMKPQACPAE